MNKPAAISSRLCLLPLAAALLLAWNAGANANSRSGVRTASRFEALDAGADVKQLFKTLRQRRPPQPERDQTGHETTTRAVRNCNDHGSGSLRDAVASASSGDTLDLGNLRCSVITLTSGAIAVEVDDLTIKGSRRHPVVVDGNNADRVFDHRGTGTLSLSDMALVRGHATASSGFVYGGCIVSAGSVALDHAAIAGCDVSSPSESAYGGGLFAAGTATLDSSAVLSNTVHGAIHAVGAGVLAYANVVRNSTISWNSAVAVGTATLPEGNAIDASMGGVGSIDNLDISDSLIHGNTVSASSSFSDQIIVANEAGAHTFSILTLTRSTVSDNAARSMNTASSLTDYIICYSIAGGVRGASLVITDSTISGNSSSSIATNPQGVGYTGVRGGGIHTLGHYGGLTLSNSTVSGNKATRSTSARYPYGYSTGGGIEDNGVFLTLQNSTIALNTSELGSGIYVYNTADIHAESTIVARNTSSAGGTDFDVFEPMTVVGANNLLGSSSVALTLPVGTLFGDPRLAPLADNGGPTLTHALRPDSPAIDRGNNVAGFTFDQRGPGFPRKVGRATDIGAFERRAGH